MRFYHLLQFTTCSFSMCRVIIKASVFYGLKANAKLETTKSGNKEYHIQNLTKFARRRNSATNMQLSYSSLSKVFVGAGLVIFSQSCNRSKAKRQFSFPTLKRNRKKPLASKVHHNTFTSFVRHLYDSIQNFLVFVKEFPQNPFVVPPLCHVAYDDTVWNLQCFTRHKCSSSSLNVVP